MNQWRRAMTHCRPLRGSDALTAGSLTPEARRFHRGLETKPEMGSGLKQTQRRREVPYGAGRLK